MIAELDRVIPKDYDSVSGSGHQSYFHTVMRGRPPEKYFAVRDPSKEGLAPNFLVVANVEATDGGKALAAGNSRVLSARLNDARFFWDEDQKVGFDAWNAKLSGVTFHAKLGTLAERVERIVLGEGRLLPVLAILEGEQLLERLVGMPADLALVDPGSARQYQQAFPELAKVPRIGQGAADTFSLEQVLTASNYQRIEGLGQRLAEGLRLAFATYDLPWQAFQLGPRSGFCLTAELPRNGAEANLSMDAEFIDCRRLFMANRGIWDGILSAGPQVSFAHTEADIDRYVEVASAFLAELFA